MPPNISFEEIAPATEGVHYAFTNIRAAKVASGQRVLINGATGAIGSAAVQLVKHMGAHVTAVCSTNNVVLVKSLGANVVIDYMAEDFTKGGRDGQTYDLVFDTLGKSAYLCDKHKTLLHAKTGGTNQLPGQQWQSRKPFPIPRRTGTNGQ